MQYIDWVWKSALVVVFGILLLRVAGRKSISQMTLAQTVLMIAIGSLLIQPIAGKNIWVTFAVGGGLVLYLITIELLQLKFDWIERLVTGRSIILIQNGSIVEKKLKRSRLTVDQLEMQLRQANIADISDVQFAALEPSGKVSFVLTEQARPASKREIALLKNDMKQLTDLVKQLAGQPKEEPLPQDHQIPKPSSAPLFDEVIDQGHPSDPPKHLQ